MVETCCVVDQECLSPANLEPPVPVKARCFACDQPVCVNCSKRVRYFEFGRRRICADCQEEHGVGDARAA